jgi:hypothetical protein
MSQHIIPQDSYNHIQDIACGCNPTISVVEGEEICYHNFKSKDVELLRDLAMKLKNNQTDIDPEFKEIVDKTFWNLI